MDKKAFRSLLEIVGVPAKRLEFRLVRSYRPGTSMPAIFLEGPLRPTPEETPARLIYSPQWGRGPGAATAVTRKINDKMLDLSRWLVEWKEEQKDVDPGIDAGSAAADGD